MVQSGTTHFVRDVPTLNVTDIMANPDSFRIFYFPIEGLGQTARDILAFGGAKWESVFPEKWATEKDKTPFGCLPVLFINKGGKEVHISEVSVIDSYLANHFGLLGDNLYEESLIKAFHSSSMTLIATFSTSVAWNVPEAQEKAFGYFKMATLPNWIKTHERHLVDNGSNGHYIGDKLSLADIKTSNAIDHLAHQPNGKEMIEMIRASPSIWKVKETVDAKLAKWRACEDFKKLASSTTEFYLDPMAAVSAM
ncbi:hypothetical protein BGZ76_008241 [Entomortierella beljakovae]|nr:hypothetical protein BGZ76_008241 [Entomortierella beljakovae]